MVTSSYKNIVSANHSRIFLTWCHRNFDFTVCNGGARRSHDFPASKDRHSWRDAAERYDRHIPYVNKVSKTFSAYEGKKGWHGLHGINN